MFLTTRGLVLREVRYKESDKILTVLTQHEGKVTVRARGALRKGSRITAATQLLTYSDMTIFENRGRRTLNEASTVEEFLGLRADLGAFALGSYFAELLELRHLGEQFLGRELRGEPVGRLFGCDRAAGGDHEDMLHVSLSLTSSNRATQSPVRAASPYNPRTRAQAVCGPRHRV